MTDITELAQREKFEAWWEREYKHLESSKYTDAVPHIKYGFWMAYQAGGAELVEALEKAQSANAAQDDHINQQQDRIEQLEKRNAELGKYDKELESFRTAYMEWSDKTDWVQGDKRFDVLIPWGKHRADVLKAYIEYLELRIAELESRTVTVKLSKDHVDDADLFGWGVVVVPLEALKDACVNAGVTVEIADAGIKVEAE
ncbi:hypothetical protein AB0132_04055 [Klebsiella quasipneumoniae]|uniref:hypothetical protein n=1 Tax=Klebsiella quasipneumoniae TaxID=1463165 RepID=UPI00344E71EA